MDIGSIAIILSVALSGLFMIIGPIMEVKGYIFFQKPLCEPKTKGRYGIGIMTIGGILFVLGLILRINTSSLQVTPFVIGGYVLWFLGGIIALLRNETLSILENGRGE
jgi:hypothetical protein